MVLIRPTNTSCAQAAMHHYSPSNRKTRVPRCGRAGIIKELGVPQSLTVNLPDHSL